MPLKLRPTGIGSGIDKDCSDYTIYAGEWEGGRISQTRGGADSLRWFWALTVNGPMTRSDRVATLEDAKAQFQRRRAGSLEPSNFRRPPPRGRPVERTGAPTHEQGERSPVAVRKKCLAERNKSGRRGA